MDNSTECFLRFAEVTHGQNDLLDGWNPVHAAEELQNDSSASEHWEFGLNCGFIGIRPFGTCLVLQRVSDPYRL